jgi:DNA-binding transcriptional MerR regulator
MSELSPSEREELELLRNQKAAREAAEKRGISFKVSEKGAVSVYGLGRFPVTLYQEQWEKLLKEAENIRTFIAENKARLKAKESADWEAAVQVMLCADLYRVIVNSGPISSGSRSADFRSLDPIDGKPLWQNRWPVQKMASEDGPPKSVSQDFEFGSASVCQIARVSRRQLQWWDERKVISPRQQSGRRRRVYALTDVIAMVVVAELRRRGFSLQKLRPLMRSVRGEIEKNLDALLSGTSDRYMLTDGKVRYFEDDPTRIIELLKRSRKPFCLISVSEQARRVAEFHRNAAKRDRRRNPQFSLF